MAIQAIPAYSPQVATKPVAATPTPTQDKAPAETVAATEPAASSQPTQESVSKILEALNPLARNLQFSIDDATGRTIVKVVDAKTNEVIRQIPSEDLLELAHSMNKLSGLFIKQKV